MKKLLAILMVATLLSVVFAPASIAMAASVTRDMPSSVIAGENFDIDINTFDYGAFGQVVETLPAGFSYVSSTLSTAAVDIEGQVVKFTLLGETSFTYTVKASSSAGTHAFSGILKDEDKVEYSIGGDTQIVIPVNRNLPSSVTAGTNFNIDINTFDYGAFGQVVETLPAGFSYVSSTLSTAAVDIEGQVVKFTLLGETSFTYTVKASSSAGTYAFSGILKDEDKVEYSIGGCTQITVSVTAITPVSPAGGAPPADYTETDFFGSEESVRISGNGEILETFTATSEDGDITLTISEGTIALDKDGEPLSSLTANIDPSPPNPPEGDAIIGLVYDFGPEGATFDPPITLIFTYDPDDIPAGAEPIVMEWDEVTQEWVELEDYTVDTETNTITALIKGFSKYAVMTHVTTEREAPIPELYKEEEPVVEEEETVVEEEVEVIEEEEVAPEKGEEIIPTGGIAWWVWLIIGVAVLVVAALLVYFLWYRRRFD